MFLVTLGMGQAAAMPVQDAVRMGLSIRPEVRAAELDAKAAKSDVSVAKSGYFPSVSVSGGPTNSINGAAYDVTASQTVYDWGHTASQVAGAKAMYRQLAQDRQVKRDTAALDIVGIYLDVLAAQQRQEVDNQHIARLRQLLDMTQSRSAGGYSDDSEPARTALDLASAREALATDEGNLRDAQNQFRLLVGAMPADLTEPNPQPLASYVAKAGLDTLVSQAPTYLKAGEDMRYAEAQLRAAKSVLLPQLNVEATASRDDIGGIPVSQSYVGVRLRMNTFQGPSNFQRVGSARARVTAAAFKQDATTRDISRDVQSLLDKAAMLERQEAALREQAHRSIDISSIYQEQFHAGRRDVIELLNVQLERFQAERALIDAHLQRIRTQYQAAAELGLIEPLLEGRLAK